MDNVEHIFEAFGGTGKFAAALGLKGSTASEMRRRHTIPVRYWPKLVRAAKAEKISGVSYDALVEIHARQH